MVLSEKLDVSVVNSNCSPFSLSNGMHFVSRFVCTAGNLEHKLLTTVQHFAMQHKNKSKKKSQGIYGDAIMLVQTGSDTICIKVCQVRLYITYISNFFIKQTKKVLL